MVIIVNTWHRLAAVLLATLLGCVALPSMAPVADASPPTSPTPRTQALPAPLALRGGPVARSDSAAVQAGSSVTVDVLANDTVTLSWLGRVKVLAASTGLSAKVAQKKVVITAAADASGPGTVRYRVIDLLGRKSAATIAVTIEPASNADDTLTALIAALPVAAEHRDGYDRDLFKIWVDADHDGCDTRREVLIAEAVTAPIIGSGCSFTGGSWYSYYDGATTTDSSKFDIDHVVPLAEGWDSGAWTWTAARREAYANDLDDPRSLVAVSASSNRSKSDRDPAEWLPTLDQCRYVTDWTVVKSRWGLSVDTDEKAALTRVATDCPTINVTFTPAP